MDTVKAKLTIGAALKHLDTLEQAVDGLSLQVAESAISDARGELWTLQAILDEELNQPGEEVEIQDNSRFRIIKDANPDIDKAILRELDEDWKKRKTARTG